jgi:DNA primase large subunit
MEKLIFASKFPFSENAREYLKEMDVSMDKLPESAIKRAALFVSRAFSATPYFFDQENPSRAQLELELVAFPIAKMFVSLMHAPNMNEKFSLAVKKLVFSGIVETKDPKTLALALADDFKINYSITEDEEYFISLPLLEYIGIYFVDGESKLLGKNVVGGKVFLNMNDFARFLSEKAYAKVFDSLPIDPKQIPKELHSLAKSIDSQLVVIEKKTFDLKLAGKIDPTLFPPCMKFLYADQLAGKKLPYLARLSLAAFLYQLGMPKPEMMTLFSKSPDFKSHIAEYHIDRIFEKELSAPGCTKMEEYGLKVSECNKECTFKHPVQYYISKLRTKNRLLNKSGKLPVRTVE